MLGFDDSATGAPVLRLRSKRGKWLVEAVNANRRTGIGRIVREGVRRVVRGRVEAEDAVAVKGVRATAAMKEKGGVAGSCQRPFILDLPSAIHHENPRCALALHAI